MTILFLRFLRYDVSTRVSEIVLGTIDYIAFQVLEVLLIKSSRSFNSYCFTLAFTSAGVIHKFFLF